MSTGKLRAYASTKLTFGLVVIPVKLHSTQTASRRIDFNTLHSCGERVRMHQRCPSCGDIDSKDLRKGYEIEKDTYVTFTSDEVKDLKKCGSENFKVQEFVKPNTIRPRLYSNAYYLRPDKGAEEAYTLLTKTLKRANRWGIGQYINHGVEHLAVLYAETENDVDFLVLQHLHFPASLRPSSDVYEQKLGAVPADQLKLAKAFVETLLVEEMPVHTSEQERIMRDAIEAKIAGREFAMPKAEEKAKPGDILEQLKASLGGQK